MSTPLDFTRLLTEPPGLNETLRQIDALDAALTTGLSRLPEQSRADLDNLAGVFVHSPLAMLVADAVGRVQRAEFSVSACLGLAAARTALMGAAYDALRAQLHGDAPLVEDDTAALPVGDDAALLAGVQQWLAELAVTGLEQLTEAQLLPFAPVLAQMQTRPPLTGLAALLAGFVDERVAAHQQKLRDDLPARRWADLWSAAMLGAQSLAAAPAFTRVSGTLHPCGVDVRAHRSLAQATLWGLLETSEGLRVVRWPSVSWKVSVLSPDEIWRALGPAVRPVLAALAEGKSLRLADAELSAAGDLGVTTEVEPSAGVDLFSLPSNWSPMPSLTALARHPIHLVELVRLDACNVADGFVEVVASGGGSGVKLPLALERMRGIGPELDEKHLAATTDMIGLLRWDAGWRIQPLAVRGGGKLKNGLRVGQGIAGRLAKLKTETLPQLQERASRLLRA